MLIYIKEYNPPEFEDFYTPFGGKTRSDNRWVLLAKTIPWGVFERKYSRQFSKSFMGRPAKPVRVALGALIIQERMKLTDEETVLQIQETHYLQYFLGFDQYRDEPPFDPSMMVHFRKRFSEKILAEINDLIVKEHIKRQQKIEDKKKSKSDDEPSPPVHKEVSIQKELFDEGDISQTLITEVKSPRTQKKKSKLKEEKDTLIIDASCAPADIKYPTDLSLLNDAREKSEMIIDRLFEPLRGSMKKLRTYRHNARRDFLRASKSRRLSAKKLRKAIRKQLCYLSRNLGHINTLSKKVSLTILKKKSYQNLLVISELYRQQKQMFDARTHSIADRIVSISQPHIRPIVRGKKGRSVEFGAKVSFSCVQAFVFLDHLSWDSYNESTLLGKHIRLFYKRFGRYPARILADQIYLTRYNRKLCRRLGIEFVGKPLGRPKKNVPKLVINKGDRNPIEGKFGEAKRRYKMNLNMGKLPQTSATIIGMAVLSMNIGKILRDFFWLFWKQIRFIQKKAYRIKIPIQYC